MMRILSSNALSDGALEEPSPVRMPPLDIQQRLQNSCRPMVVEAAFHRIYRRRAARSAAPFLTGLVPTERVRGASRWRHLCQNRLRSPRPWKSTPNRLGQTTLRSRPHLPCTTVICPTPPVSHSARLSRKPWKPTCAWRNLNWILSPRSHLILSRRTAAHDHLDETIARRLTLGGFLFSRDS